VLGDQVGVVHQLLRGPEGKGVHLLDDVGLDGLVGHIKENAVGLVHVAHLQVLVPGKFAGNAKRSADGPQLRLHVHRMVSFACSHSMYYIMDMTVDTRGKMIRKQDFLVLHLASAVFFAVIVCKI